ncbi:hypothetical protein ACFQ3N_18660 [Virgibacillus byunsanensis]|uniref:Uncharacterized protein n=1 Tax=Virgibacillus byunsanensis TaxID=570945 RepID=A0ABW3LRX2_9BACI
MTKYKNEIILVLIPFVYGLLANLTDSTLLTPVLTQIIFLLFWYLVGVKFAKLNKDKITSFLYGNSIWGLSFLVFIWQFILLDDNSRNFFLAGVSQYYMFPFIWIGRELTVMFIDVYHGTTIMLLAYLSMLVIFLLGFSYGWMKEKLYS